MFESLRLPGCQHVSSAGPKPLTACFIWQSSGCTLLLCSPCLGLPRRGISWAPGKLWTNFGLSTSFLHPLLPLSSFPPSLPPSQGCCWLLPPPPSLNLQRDWKEAELISRLKLRSLCALLRPVFCSTRLSLTHLLALSLLVFHTVSLSHSLHSLPLLPLSFRVVLGAITPDCWSLRLCPMLFKQAELWIPHQGKPSTVSSTA